MELTVIKRDLEQVLSILMNVVPGKTTTIMTSNILMETEENKLKLTATDLETTVIFEIPADITKSGSVVVGGRKFYELVKNLDESNITLSVSRNNLNIVWEDGNYRLVGTSKEDYTEIPIVDKTKAFYMRRRNIVRGTDYTKICVSRNDSQRALTGIYTKILGDEFIMVSTDSFRLSSYKVKTVNEGMDNPLIAILPVKALDVLIKSSVEEEEIGVIIIDGKRVDFVLSNGVISTHVINEQYPDYEKVIQTRNPFSDKDSHLVVNKEILTKALKRVIIFSDPHSKTVSLRLSEEGLYVKSEYRDTGDGGEKIEGNLKGESLEVSVNAQYLLDIIGRIETTNVCIDMKSPNDSIVIYEDTDDDDASEASTEEIFYLLMPTYVT